MLLIGHRGCHYAGYNQNTIRAFAKVTQEGASAIEFDVQLCGDGQLVVVHNLALDEVSTGSGKVISTDSRTLKSLYAGDPSRSRDRIPLLEEVFDFFASFDQQDRPAMHLELKGDGTGIQTGKLLASYVTAGKLQYADLLVSSFNWQELVNIRTICPALKIALLDGLISRKVLVDKVGPGQEHLFQRIFIYGAEQYMVPRFPSFADNLELLEKECPDLRIRMLLADEIESCLAGSYYTDVLLDTAVAMDAVSVNLWYRSLSSQFIARAHSRGLAVYVYTVNGPDELLEVAKMGVDGIFTDYYVKAAHLLTGHTQ